jgi:hypothetical protein
LLPVTPRLLVLLLFLQPLLSQRGDYLLSQLDLCCPRLRQLAMPGLAIDGRGIQVAAGTMPRAALAAAAAGGGEAVGGEVAAAVEEVEEPDVADGASGLRSLQRLELCAAKMTTTSVSCPCFANQHAYIQQSDVLSKCRALLMVVTRGARHPLSSWAVAESGSGIF